MTDTRSTPTVQVALPVAIALAGIAVGTTGFFTITSEGASSSISQRLWSTLQLFGGSYQAVPGQPPEPTMVLSWIGVAALAVTLIAVGTAVLTFATEARRRLSARLARPGLLIIGDEPQLGLLLRHDPTRSAQRAAVISRDLLFIPPPGVVAHHRSPAEIPDDGTARRLIAHAKHVVVAGADTGENLALRRQISGFEHRAADQVVIAMVDSWLLSDELRAIEIDQTVPSFDTSNPDENIAEHVTHLLDAVLAAIAIAEQPTTEVRVEIVDCDSQAASDGLTGCLVLWLGRFARSRAFLRATNESALPPITVSTALSAGASTADTITNITIYSGVDSAVVAGRLLADRRLGRLEDVALAVALCDSRLLPDITDSRRWLDQGPEERAASILVVDVMAVGWDVDLVCDHLGNQWARAYHQGYSVMHNAAAEPWNLQSPLRNEQSSLAGSAHMLRLLHEYGWHLVRTDDAPRRPGFDVETVEAMARAEHESWRERMWKDPDDGARKRVADGRDADVDFDDLDPDTKTYNRRVPVETFPAVAASFGYEIQRRSA